MLGIRRNEWSPVFGFFTIGLLIGQVGPILNEASMSLGIDSSQIGTIMTVFFGTSLIGIVLGVFWADRFGKEVFALVGSLFVISGYATGCFAQSYHVLLVAYAVIGTGLGFYQIGFNALGVDAASQYPLRKRSGKLAFFQFFFGLGAILVPYITVLAMNLFGGWNPSFGVVLLLGPIPVSFVVFKDFVRNKPARKTGETRSMPKVKYDLVFGLIVLAGFFYAALEGSTFNWIPYFWDRNFENGRFASAPQVISAFWIVFSLSRLGVGKLIEKTGPAKALILGGGCSVLFLILWVVLGDSAIASFALILGLGLVYGCMIPTLMIVINHVYPGRSATVSSILFISLTLSITLCSSLVGFSANSFGVRAIPVLLLLFACAFLAFFSAASIRMAAQLRG